MKFVIAFRRVGCLLLALMLFAATGVAAQSDPDQDVPGVTSPNANSAAPITVTPPVSSKKDGEWVILPIPQSSPAIGTGLQVVGARFFRTDQKSQPSVIGAGGAYYTSDTWFTGIGGALNFAEGRWRIEGGVGYVNANYDFYGVGTGAGDRGIEAPINQTGTAALVKAMRLVGNGWYAGVGYRYLDSQVGIRAANPNLPDLDQILNEGVSIVATGPLLLATYDTRNLSTNPHRGSYVEFEGMFATKSLGSDQNYQRATIYANHYWPLGEDYTLAGRISACGVTDNTPFFDLCLYGSHNDLRGYTVGRYQDLTMLTAQAELRMQLLPRWGAVVFGGVGQVAASFDEMNSDNMLPGGGFGIRWMAAPANKVNIRADFAWGEGDGMLFYLAIGEAF